MMAACLRSVRHVLTGHVFCSLIAFTDKEPKDFMVPSRWGTVSIPDLRPSRSSTQYATD